MDNRALNRRHSRRNRARAHTRSRSRSRGPSNPKQQQQQRQDMEEEALQQREDGDGNVPFYSCIPRYSVDLAEPARQRWKHVARDCAELLPDIIDKLERIYIGENRLALFVYRCVCGLLSLVCLVGQLLGFETLCELWGFASACPALSSGKLLIVQYIYEASTCCTSVVFSDRATGTPVHLRTMDWDLGFDIRDLTICVDFTRGRRHEFTCTTWCGYMGVLTAQKPGAFSVSVNYREQGGVNEEGAFLRLTLGTLRTLSYGILCGRRGVGAAVRDAVECARDFDAAVAVLSAQPLISPCYFIVAGTKCGEGVGITRTPRASLRPQKLGDDATGAKAVVQANTDWWVVDPLVDMMESKERRKLATKMLESVAKAGTIAAGKENAAALRPYWQLISTAPIRNEITIYACVMCPHSGVYQTRCNTIMAIPDVNGDLKSREYAVPQCLRDCD